MELHPQLAADCHELGRWPEGTLLLHKNAAVRWFILVPETDAVDLLDTLPALQQNLLARCTAISKVLKDDLSYPKVNFGAIGNVVPQLHLHVIGRHQNDPCWPAPVWGHLQESREYEAAEVEGLKELFASRHRLLVDR